MTAGEHQAQAVIGDPALVILAHGRIRFVGWLGGAHQVGGGSQALFLHPLVAQAVDRTVARDRRQPSAGLTRHAVVGPSPDRLGERLLRAVLGEVPVGCARDQGCDDPAPLLGEGLRDGAACVLRYHSTNGRTSSMP